jgi:predicted dehydrogenase
MPETVRVGIIGAGWPGGAHARGYLSAGGFKLAAVADLIPERRKKLMAEFQVPREYSEAKDLLNDREIDAVSVCLPNHLHAPIAQLALRMGKHVLVETPPAVGPAEARKIDAAAKKYNRVLLYALQRRFGGHEQAAKLAVAKGFAGDVYHVRAVWTRTRGIPLGTGWYTKREAAGGGALIDVGTHMLDLAWYLLGQPKPVSAYGVAHARFTSLLPKDLPFDVEDQAFGIVRFEGNKSIELAASWTINQPPHQNGTVCRVYGDEGAIEVYTPHGATLYRDFKPNGDGKHNPLKPPKTVQHTAMMRHFKDCIAGRAAPIAGGPEGVTLMQMIQAIYKSNESGKSVSI